MKASLLSLSILFLGSLNMQAQTLQAEWNFAESKVLNNDVHAFSDVSGKKNILQGRLLPDQIVDTDKGKALKLNLSEFVVNHRQLLPFVDMRKEWRIELSACCNTLGTEQVFVCREGGLGKKFADVSVGFDNTMQTFFVEVRDADDATHRVCAGEKIRKGEWYDVVASAKYDVASKQTRLTIAVNAKPTSIQVPGHALVHNAGRWIVGHGFPGGFPNSLQVRDGMIRHLSISGDDMPRVEGQNPLFTDRMTADPAMTVIGKRIYAYVGEDCAGVGGWFNMPRWLCYSTDDMRHWTAHGEVLSAAAFPYASPHGSWAGQVVERKGKYYYYVTLDQRQGGAHTIDVAVADKPTGPFVPARKDGTPLITDDMTTDSHRGNADIDPTVFIDDDGTPWMAWGNGDCYMVRLKKNMIELDGEIRKVPMRNYSEGPFFFKRNKIYYLIYAADAPGVQAEQMCYAMAPSIEGPWTYGGFVTGPANHGFTIHPSVNEFRGQWYFFYHDASFQFQGQPGGDCRRQVCAEPLYFNADGTIRPVRLTVEGVTAGD